MKVMMTTTCIPAFEFVRFVAGRLGTPAAAAAAATTFAATGDSGVCFGGGGSCSF
jgi:hypothetical protein